MPFEGSFGGIKALATVAIETNSACISDNLIPFSAALQKTFLMFKKVSLPPLDAAHLRLIRKGKVSPGIQK